MESDKKNLLVMEPSQQLDLLPIVNGNPYKMECEHKSECLKAIQLILDNEATQEQMSHFKEHMDKCLPCIENYNLEVTIRKILCDRMAKKEVPPGLAEAIKAQITRI
jgi:anti-sigma factor (TIGR02949 family)